MSAVVREAETRVAAIDVQRVPRLRTRPGRTKLFVPLSYIDDINSIRIGPIPSVNESLELAAVDAGLKSDHSNDWEGKAAKAGKHLGVYI